MASTEALPPVTSPSLILTNPTSSERELIWKGTQPHWGAALSMEDYIAREYDNLEAPLARDGGVTSWILTDGDKEPGERPLLSSCETYNKRAFVRTKDGKARDGTAHGVASVFTFPEYRGKGYARKMLSLIADELKSRQQKNEGAADFSVLWSDVGPKFYQTVGWEPFKSTYLEFPVTETEPITDSSLKPIALDDIPDLADRDEQLLRDRISKSSQVSAAVVPDITTIKWHIHRENFMCKHIFSRTPTVHGALYTPPDAPSSRIWALWTCSFYGMLDQPEKNVVRVLRLVIEDESISDETLARGIQAIASFVQKEAKEWRCSKVEVWNPEDRVRRVTEGIQSLGAKFIVRENSNIASLNWFNGSDQEVDWIANERFAWC
ncbi:hypothetical protein LB504_002448 [Fusarium proliferatum]|nr:hypothetical protein LB504_002448 [Fusarium proliferatum]